MKLKYKVIICLSLMTGLAIANEPNNFIGKPTTDKAVLSYFHNKFKPGTIKSINNTDFPQVYAMVLESNTHIYTTTTSDYALVSFIFNNKDSKMLKYVSQK